LREREKINEKSCEFRFAGRQFGIGVQVWSAISYAPVGSEESDAALIG
jgi:hypothetical protein